MVAAVVGRAAEELGDRGRDVDEATGPRHETVVAHALARDHERRAGLHDAERPVLAAVAALVLPVVRGGVQHAQVGRGGMVEELRDVVERERVRVRGARRVRVGALGVEPDEAVGGLVGERIGAVHAGALVAVGARTGAPERDRTLGAGDLVRALVRASYVPSPVPTRRRAPRHHVDDRRQLRVEQHVERAVEVAHPETLPIAANRRRCTARAAGRRQAGVTSQMAPVPLVPSVTT